jgi:hypothetical protein
MSKLRTDSWKADPKLYRGKLLLQTATSCGDMCMKDTDLAAGRPLRPRIGLCQPDWT